MHEAAAAMWTTAAAAAIRNHLPMASLPDMFCCLSHIVASHLKWREAQGRIRLEHVDNLADDVKFRRSKE